MNLNPFYHLRKYRQQSQEIAQLKQFNNLVINRNDELTQDLANERQALDKANARIQNLENELNEIQSKFRILVNAKTLSRKEARAFKNHNQPRVISARVEGLFIADGNEQNRSHPLATISPNRQRRTNDRH